jgi:hypothetical protein
MVRRLAGGRRFLAVSLADSVQKLVTLPPTREPPSSIIGERGGSRFG